MHIEHRYEISVDGEVRIDTGFSQPYEEVEGRKQQIYGGEIPLEDQFRFVTQEMARNKNWLKGQVTVEHYEVRTGE